MNTQSATPSYVAPVFVALVAVLVSMFRVSDTGALWEDSPRYANAAGMIHDWLRSGQLLEPYKFAKRNYATYPAFNVPYHGPVFPGLMGLFFLITGNVSPFRARLFIGICSAANAVLFHTLLSHLGLRRRAATWGAILFVTTPEIAFWSRDCMSETCSLTFMLGGSILFVKWTQVGKWYEGMSSFGFAQLGFLSRVATAGILPGWFLYCFAICKWKRAFSAYVVLPAVTYLAVNCAWVWFVSQFARYETVENASPNHVAMFSFEHLGYYLMALPRMVGWPLLVGGLSAALLATLPGIGRRIENTVAFWVCWLLSCYIFQLAMGTNEQRYFYLATPAFAGLTGCLFSVDRRSVETSLRFGMISPLVGVVALIINTSHLVNIPDGFVGYAGVASRLRALDEHGNVLLSCPMDADLMFHYRSGSPPLKRRMIRGDRTLAIRMPNYAAVRPKFLVSDRRQLLELIAKGRIRYVVTVSAPTTGPDPRTSEMKLAHRLINSDPENFQLIGTDTIHNQMRGRDRLFEASTWRYLGALRPGQSELPVIIPTAHLEL